MRVAGRVVALAAAAALGSAGLAGCSGDDGGRTTTTGGGLSVGGLEPVSPTVPGERITDRTFVDLDGRAGTFAQFAGKPMVVNFWASWCVPCISEMPDFERAHQELGHRVTFVGVNVQDQTADARSMAERTGVTYALVRDPRSELLAWVGGAGMPTTAFVDADGTVREVISRKLSPEDLRAAIEALS